MKVSAIELKNLLWIYFVRVNLKKKTYRFYYIQPRFTHRRHSRHLRLLPSEKCLLIEENRKHIKTVSNKKSKYYESEHSKCWACNNRWEADRTISVEISKIKWTAKTPGKELLLQFHHLGWVSNIHLLYLAIALLNLSKLDGNHAATSFSHYIISHKVTRTSIDMYKNVNMY